MITINIKKAKGCEKCGSYSIVVKFKKGEFNTIVISIEFEFFLFQIP